MKSGSQVVFCADFALFVLAAAQMIMCLCTSLTMGHLVFWLFQMMT